MKRNSSKPKRRYGDAGFTLVELVVVIAVLAILAGVGAVAYNGYIEYAKKGVDRKTAGEVIQAIELANYDDPSLFENGGVVYISGPDGNGTTGGDTATNAALSNALGDLTTVKLTYDGWGLESFSESIKTGFKDLMDNTTSKANAYWKAVSDNGKTATFAADVDDLWEHFTALKSSSFWKPENVGKAVKMSNEKQDEIINIWTNGTSFNNESICKPEESVYLALSMARNYSFAAYAEKNADLTDEMKKELEQFKLSSGSFGAEMLLKDDDDGKTDTLQNPGWRDVIAAYYADEAQLKSDALGYLAIMEAANVIAGGNPTAMDSDEFLSAMEPHLGTVSGTLTKGKSALEAAMAVTGENAQILVAKNADGTVTCKVYPRDLDPRDQSGSGNEEKSNAPTTVSTSATANFNAGTINSNAGDGVIALNPDGSVLIQFNSSTIPNKQKVTKISVNGVEYTATETVPLENGKIDLSINNKSSSLKVIGGSQANVSEDVTIELTAGEDTYTLKFTLWTISE